jgi:hypothetical protein
MRVRDWQDILEDVVESKAEPDGWRAVAGNRRRGLGEDLFFGHPRVGVFQLKTYAKNPYEVKGVGAEVARRLDDELDPLFPGDSAGRFGVQRRPEDEDDAERTARRLQEVIRTHADAPTTGGALFEDVMAAMDSPAFGPMEYDMTDRPEGLDVLSETFEEAEELLNAELDDLVEADEVDRGFM